MSLELLLEQLKRTGILQKYLPIAWIGARQHGDLTAAGRSTDVSAAEEAEKNEKEEER
jgi:hypothetical protein